MSNKPTMLGDSTMILNGLAIKPNDMLVGQKSAVEMDGVVHVSPAVFSLMEHANGEELSHLMKHLTVLRLGKYDPTKLDERNIVPLTIPVDVASNDAGSG